MRGAYPARSASVSSHRGRTSRASSVELLGTVTRKVTVPSDGDVTVDAELK
ncbi:MAG TPA: hypothetical protein VG496_11775 [Myxococcales bacterium]|nr:hypothetical protein [Myxococcales bacterium]